MDRKEIKALVVPAGERGRVPAEVQRYAAAQLTVRARLRLWEAVDRIPRNAAGKIWRAHLWSRERRQPSGETGPAPRIRTRGS